MKGIFPGFVMKSLTEIFFGVCVGRVVVLSSRSSYPHDGGGGSASGTDDGVNLHVLTGHEATY